MLKTAGERLEQSIKELIADAGEQDASYDTTRLFVLAEIGIAIVDQLESIAARTGPLNHPRVWYPRARDQIVGDQ